MAKAKLLEVQSRRPIPRPVATLAHDDGSRADGFPATDRRSARATAGDEPEEMSGRPKPRCHVPPQRIAGLPNGREPQGNGVLVVVRGRESRPHGEGGQVTRGP